MPLPFSFNIYLRITALFAVTIVIPKVYILKTEIAEIKKENTTGKVQQKINLLALNLSGYKPFPGELNARNFLDQLKKLSNPWRNIYILSSSVSKIDTSKAKTYMSVKGYLVKPLTISSLKNILQDQMVD